MSFASLICAGHRSLFDYYLSLATTFCYLPLAILRSVISLLQLRFVICGLLYSALLSVSCYSALQFISYYSVLFQQNICYWVPLYTRPLMDVKFLIARSVTQGDPLSPTLFILCIECLANTFFI